MKQLFLALIRVYQLTFSPETGCFRQFYFAPFKCRFEESCSHYAYRVIKENGAFTGLKLAIQRLSRCH